VVRLRPSRLSPEDAGRVAVDLGEKVVDSVRGCEEVVEVEAEAAVIGVLNPSGRRRSPWSSKT
jgi:hypothetical protein